jgi:hypothetical protein
MSPSAVCPIRFARRPRRGPHAHSNAECVTIYAPTADEDLWFGFCESLGLWRIKAPPFDAHGTSEADGGIDSFCAALAEAVVAIRNERPDLAEHFESLLDRRDGV